MWFVKLEYFDSKQDELALLFILGPVCWPHL